MILPFCRFPKPTFRKPERPSRGPSLRPSPGHLPPYFSCSVPSFTGPLLANASLRFAATNFAAINCDQLHFASLRCNLQSTVINSTSLRSAAIYNQLRSTPLHFALLQSTINSDQLRHSAPLRRDQLRCNLQPTPNNFATPLRFTANNSDQLRFTSLHKSAATQGSATSRLSGSPL